MSTLDVYEELAVRLRVRTPNMDISRKYLRRLIWYFLQIKCNYTK